MSCQIRYTKKAIKGLKKAPAHIQSKIASTLKQIANGNTDGIDVSKLQGREGYRFRTGNYRTLYSLDHGVLTVLVLDIGPRGGIY